MSNYPESYYRFEFPGLKATNEHTAPIPNQQADAEAEIERLKSIIREAEGIIREAKRKFAPHTTNSDADMWLARHGEANNAAERKE